MMAQRIARIRRKLGVSRSMASSIAALAYGEGKR